MSTTDDTLCTSTLRDKLAESRYDRIVKIIETTFEERKTKDINLTDKLKFQMAHHGKIVCV